MRIYPKHGSLSLFKLTNANRPKVFKFPYLVSVYMFHFLS